MKKRPRFASEDLHTRARRFGTPVSIALSTNEVTRRKQVEVVVDMSYFRRTPAPPLILTVELRRVLFWMALLTMLFSSAGAFQVTPGRVSPWRSSVPARTDMSQASSLSASMPLNEVPSQRNPQSLLNSILPNEVSVQLGEVSSDFAGADSFYVSAVASNIFSLVSEGEISVDKLKTYFSRACLSALMHKAVGAGMTLAACAAHLPQ